MRQTSGRARAAPGSACTKTGRIPTASSFGKRVLGKTLAKTVKAIEACNGGAPA